MVCERERDLDVKNRTPRLPVRGWGRENWQGSGGHVQALSYERSEFAVVRNAPSVLGQVSSVTP